jgi:hypothetical protein
VERAWRQRTIAIENMATDKNRATENEETLLKRDREHGNREIECHRESKIERK